MNYASHLVLKILLINLLFISSLQALDSSKSPATSTSNLSLRCLGILCAMGLDRTGTLRANKEFRTQVVKSGAEVVDKGCNLALNHPEYAGVIVGSLVSGGAIALGVSTKEVAASGIVSGGATTLFLQGKKIKELKLVQGERDNRFGDLADGLKRDSIYIYYRASVLSEISQKNLHQAYTFLGAASGLESGADLLENAAHRSSRIAGMAGGMTHQANGLVQSGLKKAADLQLKADTCIGAALYNEEEARALFSHVSSLEPESRLDLLKLRREFDLVEEQHKRIGDRIYCSALKAAELKKQAEGVLATFRGISFGVCSTGGSGGL
jgi:hypothetical protein